MSVECTALHFAVHSVLHTAMSALQQGSHFVGCLQSCSAVPLLVWVQYACAGTGMSDCRPVCPHGSPSSLVLKKGFNFQVSPRVHSVQADSVAARVVRV